MGTFKKLMGNMFRVTFLVCAIFAAVTLVAEAGLSSGAKDELAQKAIEEALRIGMGVLDNFLFDSFYEDAAKVCYWNDWEARDGRARIEKTFKRGRMTRIKRTLGNPNGRWYCCYTQGALLALGHDLDY